MPVAVRTRQAAGTKSCGQICQDRPAEVFVLGENGVKKGTGCLRILNRQQPRKALKKPETSGTLSRN
jgi:hypothetical protein